MKKLWKIKKDSEAVSPVIATILMVAITVVLAAVLLVLVLNIGEDSVPTNATLVWSAGTDNTTGEILVQIISQSTSESDLRLDQRTGSGSWAPADATLSGGGNNVVSGSVYEVEDLTAGTTYEFRLVYTPSGAVLGQTSGSTAA